MNADDYLGPEIVDRVVALEGRVAELEVELDAVKVEPLAERLDLSQRLSLTVPEAARALGVSERHLRGILSSLPHVHLGGRLVLPVDLLREHLRRTAQLEAKQVEGIVETALARVGMK